MDLLHAAALGTIQGLTEVLPISSSAHLILVPRFLHWPESGLTFDVALHLGTLIALLVYFWRDVLELFLGFLSGLAARFQNHSDRLPLYIIAATFPAAVVGKLLEDHIEAMFRSNPLLIAVILVCFALVLAFADTTGSKRWKMDHMRLQAAMTIGVAQALALVPGVSRSGITITAALLLGFNRETAARFSFLLSLPIVAGAGVLKLAHLAKSGIPAGEAAPMLVGMASAAFFGYISILLLLKMVQRSSLYPFVWYRIVAGTAIIAFLLAGK